MKQVLPILLFSLLLFHAEATHIVGGFVSYRFISGTTYEITLTAYRDCNSNVTLDGIPFPDGNGGMAVVTPRLSIFDNSGNFIDSIILSAPAVTTIGPPSDNPCLTNTSGVCVEQGVYTTTYTFPSSVTSYYVQYVRCCRNGSINNLFEPGTQGGTYSVFIPATSQYQNTSPVFNNFPPIFICVNAPLRFDHSATDADGDQLTYSLCSPFLGGDTLNPSPEIPLGPPYSPIIWESGYSANNPLGSNNLFIDAGSGYLTGVPNTIGQFVVGVCVSEYRNGVLLATYIRDFQFNVTRCNIPVANIPSSNINPVTGIGTYIINCDSRFVQFQNTSYNPPPASVPLTYEWDFGVAGITTDTSTGSLPSFVYPDTGTYLVRLNVIKGTGPNACFDTTYAYVKIYPKGNTDFNSVSACPYSPVQFSDLSTTPDGTITGWQWSFGDGDTSSLQNPAHIYSASGSYPVTLVSQNSYGCKDTLQKSTLVFASPNSDFDYTPPCINSVITFSLANNNNVASYSWTFPNGSSSSLTSPSYTFNSAGTYPVALITTSNDGCRDTTVKDITVQLPVTAVTQSPFHACEGNPVQLFASGGLYYEWVPHTGLNNPFTSDPFAMPGSTTFYTVYVSNDCYTDSATAQVIVHPLPVVDAGPDTTIWRDTYAELHGFTNETNHFWNPSTWLDDPFELNTRAQPPQTQWYELFAIDEYGCMNKDSVLVTVELYTILDIPTAFSPDGNGVNDIFRIVRWLNVFELKEFSVYNRWGQKVFETSDISQGWNGTYKGIACQLGVYVWSVVAKTREGKEIVRKGNVTLLR